MNTIKICGNVYSLQEKLSLNTGYEKTIVYMVNAISEKYPFGSSAVVFALVKPLNIMSSLQLILDFLEIVIIFMYSYLNNLRSVMNSMH